MVKDRHREIVEVHMLIERNDKILLGRRQNTGYHDGDFHLPAGHLEANETFVNAAIREAKEELGVNISQKNLGLAYLLHHDERVGIFFSVVKLDDEPRNMEPDKCSTLEWFDLNHLPINMVPYAKFVLQELAKGKNFGVYND